MSPGDCSHINIQTIHFGVVEIELLPTEFPWCMVHTACAEDPVRFREGIDIPQGMSSIHPPNLSYAMDYLFHSLQYIAALLQPHHE